MIIGIDPGAKGAICLYSGGLPPEIFWMKDKTNRDIREFLYSVKSNALIDWAVMEQVHAAPGQGVSSMFNFGKGVGFLTGLLAAFEIPLDFVTPQVWQKEFSLGRKYPTTALRKTAHKQKAQQLFPRLDGINQETADAVLIAEYGWRKRRNRLEDLTGL